jgi:hypothetical protein
LPENYLEVKRKDLYKGMPDFREKRNRFFGAIKRVLDLKKEFT